jgi:hypothetical protein
MQSQTWIRPSSAISAAFLAATLGLGIRAASADSHPSATAAMTEQPTNDQSPQGLGIDEALVKRWAELFSYILAEFRADRRDPTAAIEGDYTTRHLRIRRVAPANGWVDRTLTEKELRTANLRALAKRLYAESARR